MAPSAALARVGDASSHIGSLADAVKTVGGTESSEGLGCALQTCGITGFLGWLCSSRQIEVI